MARTSRLLSILIVSQDFLTDFSSRFSNPRWVMENSGIPIKNAQRQLNYLRRKKHLDQKYYPVNRGNSTYSLINQSWDGAWRLASYEISQNERGKRREIRDKLVELGFKQFQRSMWASPLKVEDYFKQELSTNKPKVFSIFIGKLYGQSAKEIIKDLWPVKQWKKQARDLISKINKKRDYPDTYKKMFWDLVLKHPKIPLDLLSFYWPMEDLVDRFLDKIDEEKY